MELKKIIVFTEEKREGRKRGWDLEKKLENMDWINRGRQRDLGKGNDLEKQARYRINERTENLKYIALNRKQLCVYMTIIMNEC